MLSWRITPSHRATPTPAGGSPTFLAHRWARVTLVLFGICLLQGFLYGPSLIGRRVLLPLELLTVPGVYLPTTTIVPSDAPFDPTRIDLVLQFEPERRFAAEEVAARRWPRWLPYEYGGVPMRFTMLSPLFALKASTPSPLVLAWAQLLTALIAGAGIYVFSRRALGLGFWPAAIAAWCYPLSGTFVLWQGFPVADTLCWFPWLLVAMGEALRGRTWGVAAVAAVTALLLLGGQLDVAALALLACGAAALLGGGRLMARERRWGAGVMPIARVGLGFALGAMLAAPYVLPFLEYTREGQRIAERAAGHREERPPVGWGALPLVVWPDRDGQSRHGSLFIGSINQAESPAAGSVGVVAALLLAPLGWASRRHRWANILCTVAIVSGIAWAAHLPGAVAIMRWPGLNLLSFNRLVFVTGFALSVQAAIGFEVLLSDGWRRPRWFLAPAALAAGFACVTLLRSQHPTEAIATKLGQEIAQHRPVMWVTTEADVAQVQAWYRRSAAKLCVLSAVALAGWLCLGATRLSPRIIAPVLGVVTLAEGVSFAWHRSAQMPPSLYYPRSAGPAPRKSSAPRLMGFFCLPANIAPMLGFSDVRGYDPVEPARMVELLRRASDPRSAVLPYAIAQSLTPAVFSTAGQIRVPPILDLLGVEYIAFRGERIPGFTPDFAVGEYWGAINRQALPRAFVPRKVEVEPEAETRLTKLALRSFDPRAVAYVEEPVGLNGETTGAVAVLADRPTEVRLSATLNTAGLVVLVDRWDPGWRAYVNGSRSQIVRTDHALRGVVAPGGSSTVEFRYEPVSFAWGTALAAAAGITLALLAMIAGGNRGAATLTPTSV